MPCGMQVTNSKFADNSCIDSKITGSGALSALTTSADSRYSMRVIDTAFENNTCSEGAALSAGRLKQLWITSSTFVRNQVSAEEDKQKCALGNWQLDMQKQQVVVLARHSLFHCRLVCKEVPLQ